MRECKSNENFGWSIQENSIIVVLKRMIKKLAIVMCVITQGCVTAPKQELSCGYEKVERVATSSAEQMILSSRSLSQVKAQFVIGRLTEADQLRLSSAETKEQLQILIMELMIKTDSPEHTYIFAGPGSCALTKIYSGKYSETLCIQTGGAEHGFNGGDLGHNLRHGEEAIRKAITSWSLTLSCEGERCAQTSQGRFKNNYFFRTSFKDESTSVLAVEALNKYGELCAAEGWSFIQ